MNHPFLRTDSWRGAEAPYALYHRPLRGDAAKVEREDELVHALVWRSATLVYLFLDRVPQEPGDYHA